MGWWIFKSRKEKYMSSLIKRLDRIEKLMYEEREDDVLDQISERLGRLEKAFEEPEEPTAPPVSVPNTPTIVRQAQDDLAAKVAAAQGIWQSVPAWAKPFINRMAASYLGGMSVDEALANGEVVSKLWDQGSALATKALQEAQKRVQSSPQSPNVATGLLPEELPMKPELIHVVKRPEDGKTA
jgi:hypothetical protein